MLKGGPGCYAGARPKGVPLLTSGTEQKGVCAHVSMRGGGLLPGVILKATCHIFEDYVFC